MNWKLIFQLSLFGLFMAIATVFWIPSSIEPAFWALIFVFCAYVIAKRCQANYFLHGLLVSVLNSVWITAMHVAFYQSYLENHPKEAAMMADMPMPASPRLMMLLTGPVVGIVSGLILGLFALIASKLLKRTAATT